MRVDLVRLMLALKLASLARGASGVRPATATLLEAMLARGLLPVVPSQGSVGASGDLAPLGDKLAPGPLLGLRAPGLEGRQLRGPGRGGVEAPEFQLQLLLDLGPTL